jgi:hypothetical protein
MRARIAVVLLVVVGCDRADEPAPAPTVESPQPAKADAPIAPGGLGSELASEIDKAKVRCKGATGIELAVDLDGDVSGEWTGEYRYDDPGKDPVPMDATFFSTAGKLGGRTDEPNTFALPGPADLEAEVVGELHAGGRMTFMKTYDTGGQTHSVLYVGQLDDARREITGRWRTKGVTGTFTLERAGLRG